MRSLLLTLGGLLTALSAWAQGFPGATSSYYPGPGALPPPTGAVGPFSSVSIVSPSASVPALTLTSSSNSTYAVLELSQTNSASHTFIWHTNDHTQPGAAGFTIRDGDEDTNINKNYTFSDYTADATFSQTDTSHPSWSVDLGQNAFRLYGAPAGASFPSGIQTIQAVSFSGSDPIIAWIGSSQFHEPTASASIAAYSSVANGNSQVLSVYAERASNGEVMLVTPTGDHAGYRATISGSASNGFISDAVNGGRFSGMQFHNNGTLKALEVYDNTNNVFTIATEVSGAILGLAQGATGLPTLAINGKGATVVVGDGYTWTDNTSAYAGSIDSGIWRLAGASFAMGNGTAGDFSGTLKLASLVQTGQPTFASSTTGAGTQTFTNSPCGTLTSERWIPVTITGQSGTWNIPACQ